MDSSGPSRSKRPPASSCSSPRRNRFPSSTPPRVFEDPPLTPLTPLHPNLTTSSRPSPQPSASRSLPGSRRSSLAPLTPLITNHAVTFTTSPDSTVLDHDTTEEAPTATGENINPSPLPSALAPSPHTRKNPRKRPADSRPRVSGIRKADKKRILPPKSEPKFPSPITERALVREMQRRETLDPRHHAPSRKPFEPRDGGHSLARLNADVMAALGRLAPPGERREHAVAELTEELAELRIPAPLTVRARAWSDALGGGEKVQSRSTGEGEGDADAVREESAVEDDAVEDSALEDSATEDDPAWEDVPDSADDTTQQEVAQTPRSPPSSTDHLLVPDPDPDYDSDEETIVPRAATADGVRGSSAIPMYPVGSPRGPSLAGAEDAGGCDCCGWKVWRWGCLRDGDGEEGGGG